MCCSLLGELRRFSMVSHQNENQQNFVDRTCGLDVLKMWTWFSSVLNFQKQFFLRIIAFDWGKWKMFWPTESHHFQKYGNGTGCVQKGIWSNLAAEFYSRPLITQAGLWVWPSMLHNTIHPKKLLRLCSFFLRATQHLGGGFVRAWQVDLPVNPNINNWTTQLIIIIASCSTMHKTNTESQANLLKLSICTFNAQQQQQQQQQ